MTSSTSPAAALCVGEMERSAAITSHTVVGSNHTSGVTFGPSPTLKYPGGSLMMCGLSCSVSVFSASSEKPVPILQIDW